MKSKICSLFNCNKRNICCNSIHWKYNILYGGGESKWDSLYHNGPLFYPEYIQHNIPIIIKSIKYILTPLSEEYATLYSKYIGTEYTKNIIFNNNFWEDFKNILPSNILNKITYIDEIDFSLICNYLIKEKEKKLLITKEDKKQKKLDQEESEKPYKYCMINGITQVVGNYKIEPPGIFLGRGTHPQTGSIKKRLYPEDIIINISKDAIIPESNIKNHTWKKVIHDKSVIWLASWKEPITNKNKYIFTNFESFFKSKSDESKFDLARKLKNQIDTIRTNYKDQLNNPNEKYQQLATALYLIDTLALRVGNNKDTKKSADTVGVTSLRVEHISLLDGRMIILDFLGKDSIRYYKKTEVPLQVYKNLQKFIKNKNKNESIFNLISAVTINTYLKSFFKGLTSKVWRTYNASIYFQDELNKIKKSDLQHMDKNEKVNYLINIFYKANTVVAILCNHQKNMESSVENITMKIDKQINILKDKKKKYKDDKKKILSFNNKIKILELKKDTKIIMKNVSLGTSKDNYIDPRIIFAFMQKFNIPYDKLMKNLLKRFEWASTVSKDYVF